MQTEKAIIAAAGECFGEAVISGQSSQMGQESALDRDEDRCSSEHL